jgi:RNA polymerase sigma-70 factor (ECF subfamily)
MSLPDDLAEQQLIAKSKAGDRVALQELLVLHFTPLSKQIARRIPTAIHGEIDAEDVIQQTFVQVVRDIEHCRADAEASFSAWLRAIAEHRLQDAIRRIAAEKRGGRRPRACRVVSPHESSMIGLIEMLSAGSHRPSRSAMRHEAIEATREAIENLPERYREAVRLRCLEGRSLQETAAIMGRSPRAVQGLVDRAKKKLHVALDRLSVYQ